MLHSTKIMYTFQTFNRRWCGTLSNPFEKSSNMHSIWSPLFSPSENSWSVIDSWLSHDLCLRNPCWFSDRMLFASRWLMMLLYSIWSMILQQIEVRDTGRYFEAFPLSSFRNNGVISASFYWFGIFPCLVDVL